jgi:GNAT superfamily N-acetyltransferase
MRSAKPLAESTASELERIFSFQKAMRARASTETVAVPHGTAYLNTNFPIVWDMNLLQVEEPFPSATTKDLIDEVEAILGPRGYAHRKVNVLDRGTGARVTEGFRKAGWTILQVASMVLREAAERDTAIEVALLDDATYRRGRRAFLAREPYATSQEDVRQLVEKVEAYRAATDLSAFGVLVGDTVAAMCELYTDGTIAQVEDVETLEEYRGRGYATAAVLTAIRVARERGCSLIFINADAADWPKDMYARMGFVTVGYYYEFTRMPFKR